MADANMPFGGGAPSYQPQGYGRPAYGYTPGTTQGYQAQPAAAQSYAEQASAAQPPQDHAAPSRGAAWALSQGVGALMSLAIVVGVSVWGYQLIMRDVSGVPIVRAMEGPMRIAPETPGGAQAAHQGLSVNEVAGRGAAGGPADQLRLAPTPVDLTAEDQSQESLEQIRAVPGDAAAPGALTTPGAPSPQSVQDAAIQALADQIAAGVTPLTDLAPQDETAATSPLVTPQATAPANETVIAGMRSPRPQARPGALSPAVTPAVASSGSTIDLDAATLPVGTRLVQLGAYESAEIARTEWTRIAGRFDAYFAEKRRVIQRAESGDRTFYRLRVEGFSDLSDARRFCAALVAERTDCIPVVTR